MENKIIERIKKLFALAGNNPNIHESESAMRAAKKLLDKHNLSMIDLAQRDEVGVKIEDRSSMPWVRTLYYSICMYYDCKHITDKTVKPAAHLIIGTESNRVTASIVIDNLYNAIYNEGYGQGNGFRNSAAYAVYETVQELLAERNMNEAIPGTGLVLADVHKLAIQDIDNWVELNIGKVRQKRGSMTGSKAGERYGKTLNVGPRLSNKLAIE